ncbi:MAG: branched-chain-amino-acid transaminase [Planctomycetota bacterium]
MSLKIYIDGELVEEKDAKVSVFDHGLLYGDGVFEGIRAYSGKIFREQQHVKRLYNSAKAIMLDVPLPPGELAKAMYDTMAANGLSDAYIRVVVTRGAGDLGLDPRKCPRPCLIIIAASIVLYPDEFYQNGLDLVTAPTRRISTDALNPRIKSCNYLNNILAKIEGIGSGCIEALMLNSKGEVAECTGDNIFIVNGSVLKTPPPEAGILEGVTRGVVINDLAAKLGLTALEVPLTRHDLFLADECFLTGTAAEIIPVVKIDGRKIGDGKPGRTTVQLLAEFRKLTLEG